MTSPRTLLGPLTTKWTPPGVCSYAMAICDTCTSMWRAQTCNPSSNAHDDTVCWPPVASYASTNAGVLMGYGVYSPGLVCPDGYTTAAMATAGGHTGWSREYTLGADETAAACCPSGYSPSHIEATNTWAQTCVVTATSTTLETVMCDGGQYSGFNEMTIPYTADGNHISSYVLFGPLIELVFKSSDITTTTRPSSSQQTSASAPSSVSSLPSSTGATTTSGSGGTPASQTASQSSGSSNSSSSSSLSSSAKIGIGVGVGVGGLLLLVLAGLLFLRHRRRGQAGGAVAGGAAAGGKETSKTQNGPGQAELAGEDVKEMPQTPFRRGMGSLLRKSPAGRGDGPVFELPGEPVER